MRTPTIHLNGTSKVAIMQALANAAEAVRTAMDKLCETRPNGRDYYTQGESAMFEATKEYMSRLDRLQSVYNELVELFENVNQ